MKQNISNQIPSLDSKRSSNKLGTLNLRRINSKDIPAHKEIDLDEYEVDK